MKKLFTLLIVFTLFTNAKAQTWVSVTDSNLINYFIATDFNLSSYSTWYNSTKTAIDSSDFNIRSYTGLGFSSNSVPFTISSFEGIEAFSRIKSLIIYIEIMPNGFPGYMTNSTMPTLPLLTEFDILPYQNNSYALTFGSIYILNTIKKFNLYGGVSAPIYNLSPHLSTIKLYQNASFINTVQPTMLKRIDYFITSTNTSTTFCDLSSFNKVDSLYFTYYSNGNYGYISGFSDAFLPQHTGSLIITGENFYGSAWPNWKQINFSSITDLKNLELYGLGELDSLNSLPDSLIRLKISNCWNSYSSATHHGIKKVPRNFNYPKLKSVILTDNRFLQIFPKMPVGGLDTLEFYNNGWWGTFPIQYQKSFPIVKDLVNCNGYCTNTNIVQLGSNLDSFICENCCIKNINLNGFPNSTKYVDISSNGIDTFKTASLPNNFRYFNCSNNVLKKLPTLNSGLEYLYSSGNKLNQLPILPNSLIELDVNVNKLNSIPTLPKGLKKLSCQQNLLSLLPVLNDSLKFLNCSRNTISNLGALPLKLTSLYCSNNQILSFAPLPNTLSILYCDTNQLSFIPPLPPIMNTLSCTKNTSLTCLPQLTKINELNFWNTSVNCLPNRGNVNYSWPSIGSLNLCGVLNSSACNVFWNISGKVYYDRNSNCTYDSLDNALNNVKVQLWKHGALQNQMITSYGGYYSFDVNTYDTFQIKIDTTGLPFIIACPLSNQLTSIISAADSLDYNMNFGLHCAPVNDVKVSGIFSNSNLRPARIIAITNVAGNPANQYGVACPTGIGGIVKLYKSGSAKFINSGYGTITPTFFSTDSIIWQVNTFDSLNSMNAFHVNMQVDTTAQLGTQICLTSFIFPAIPDANITNNTLTSCFGISNSHDPNIKSVSPSGAVDTSQHTLTYTIQFQNTGNANAINIHVDDTLDSNLDISTLQLLAYSYEPILQTFGNNILRFNFPGINLADSFSNEPNSHGFVIFSINYKRNISNATNISNQASIYFDFNSAVVTNSVKSVICEHPNFNILNESICIGDSFLFKGIYIMVNGVYKDTLVAYNGCDSIIVLNLGVYNPLATVLNQTICSNQTYSFNHHLLTSSGVYFDTLCSSIFTLNLTVLNYSSHSYNQTICANQIVIFNNHSLHKSGIYFDTLINYNGCDSFLTLHLTVLPISNSSSNQTICSNQYYFFNGHLLNSNGIYKDTLLNYLGCDSFVVINLNVKPISNYSFNQSVCNNKSFYFNGKNIIQAGTYFDTLINYLGCDSFITCNLTFKPIFSSVLTQTICNNQIYNFNNHNLNLAGIYYDTLQNYLGCDSFITLNLSVNPIRNTVLTKNICFGNSYLFKGNNLSTSGIYFDTLINYLGCDSFITLNLHVYQQHSFTFNQTICNNQGYNFNGNFLANTGTYHDTILTYQGCDSFITLNLIVLPISNYSFNHIICSNNSYLFNQHNLNLAGIYHDTLQNYLGCDSFITLNLTVLPISNYSFNQTICNNHFYNFNSRNLNQTGIYFDTLQNYLGCDSFITLNLKVLPSGSAYSAYICSNQNYFFNGNNISSAGFYYDTLQNYLGCDSFITLNLIVKPTSSYSFNHTICAKQFYYFNNQYLNQTGVYYDTIQNHNGCDSFITLHLLVNPINNYSFNKTMCSNEYFVFNNRQLYFTGTYLDTLQNYLGCDSFITLNLTVLPVSTTAIYKSGCENNPYFFNGKYISYSGKYFDTLVNYLGCDSTVTLHYTAWPSYHSGTVITICKGSVYSYHGHQYTNSVFLADTFITSLGCDSIISVQIIAIPTPDTSVIQLDNKLIATALHSGFQWVNCTTDHEIFGATNDTFIANKSGSYAVIVFDSTTYCRDTSNCRNILVSGIEEQIAKGGGQLVVYPNPVNNELICKCANMLINTIEVSNVLGQVCIIPPFQRGLGGLNINVAALPNGIYFIKATDINGNIMNGKFVKQ